MMVKESGGVRVGYSKLLGSNTTLTLHLSLS